MVDVHHFELNFKVSSGSGFLEKKIVLYSYCAYSFFYMDVSKNRGYPKMDGENDGKTFIKME